MHHLRRQQYRKKHSPIIGINGTVNNKRRLATYSQNMIQKRINQIATIKNCLWRRRRKESIELTKMNNHSNQRQTQHHWWIHCIDYLDQIIWTTINCYNLFFADCLPSRKASRSALAWYQVLNLSALLHCIQLASAATTRACNARSVFVSNRTVPQSKGAWIK